MKVETTEEAIKRLNDAIRILNKAGNHFLADQLDDVRQFLGKEL